MIESLIGFAAVLLLVFLRLPIAFAMGLVGFVGYAYETSTRGALSMSGRLLIDTAQDYGLSVVPLFILMGLFVNKGGLSRELYQVSYAFLGHLRGGLAMATIVACGGFSAICGSSLATAATMSKVAMPQMRRYGYADSLSTASIAAGGTLGILIPPSVILVIYGLLTETSIGKLFIAGIVPGAIGILFYLFAVKFTVTRNPDTGPAGERTGWMGRFQAIRGVWAVLLLFILVIGGLYGALDFWPIHLTFSPTEAAGMGAMGAFIIALARGGLSFADVKEVLIETSYTTASLFSVLIGAWIFSNFVNIAGMPEALLAMVNQAGFSPMTVILMILAVYLILGCVFESLSMLLLTVPIFFPVIVQLDFGLPPEHLAIWFGILVLIVVEVGLITPPVGMNLFIINTMDRTTPMADTYRAVLFFVASDLFRVVLLVLFPVITLALIPW